ncbi:MAG: hypothetical protein SGPRY_010802 [Prymnesium sp.]
MAQVEVRPIPYDEVPSFREVAACGTAVVVTPIKSITRGDQVSRFDSFESISKLYEAVTQLQVGLLDDTHGYTRVVGHKPLL